MFRTIFTVSYCVLVLSGILSIPSQAADLPTIQANSAQANSGVADSSLFTVRYPITKELRSLEVYQYELIRRAMELTRDEFGDYQIIPYESRDTLQQRLAALIRDGKLVNLVWTSPGTPVATSDVIRIPIDILHGLLGYRICLTNVKAPLVLDEFDRTHSLDFLKIAQGDSWPDLKIYQHNRINAISGPTFNSLFQMLGFRRFNCLPLGVHEVEVSYDEKKSTYPFLAIDDQLLIFYEYPIYLYVSKSQPELAKRLELGLGRMQGNGEFERLFKQYYPLAFTKLRLGSRKIICLKSPFLDQSKQCSQPLRIPN